MPEKLTNNQQTVLDLLEGTKEPLKAYAILFDIQKKGIKSPLQVYRALDKLIEIGKVHKIESKNSYIACSNENCTAETASSFLICEICDSVTELKKIIYQHIFQSKVKSLILNTQNII